MTQEPVWPAWYRRLPTSMRALVQILAFGITGGVVYSVLTRWGPLS